MLVEVHWGIKRERNASAISPLALFSFILYAKALCLFGCTEWMAVNCFLCSTVTCYLPFRNIHNKAKSKKEWQKEPAESLVFISQACQIEKVVTQVFAFRRIWKESQRGTNLIFVCCLSFVCIWSTWEIVKKREVPLQPVEHSQRRLSASTAPFLSAHSLPALVVLQSDCFLSWFYFSCCLSWKFH